MKKTPWGMMTLLLITAGVLSLRFTDVTTGKIKGQIEPSNGAAKVQALSASDTFSVNVVNGSFEIGNVKPGEYNLSIEAVPPYRSTSRSGVQVTDGTTTDVGIIRLESMKIY